MGRHFNNNAFVSSYAVRKLTLITFFLIISSISCFGQKMITGIVIDSAEHKQLSQAVVTIVDAKDSMLLYVTRTAIDGKFNLNNLDFKSTKSILIFVSYPEYADFVSRIDIVNSTATFDMYQIYLITKTHLLQDVIVGQRIKSIRLIKDTIDYKADSFQVQLNANVEDLLKKLPGIQVDRDGQITAQGQKVQQVLVDGEEYFGNDPTLVTRNLRADIIDRVQVYDKKSDQASFTGIDDGKKTKTINLKIKTDKQNTYFGKASTGIGTDQYYNSELMFNKFDKKRKVAIFGISSNTGKQGLSKQDEDKFGDRSANLGYTNADLLDRWSGNYEGQGYPVLSTVGAHYNDKWNGDKQTFNSNYRFLQLQLKGSNDLIQENILPTQSFNTYQHQEFDNTIIRSSANVSYDINLDSASSIKITIDAGVSNKKTLNGFSVKNIANDGSLINESNRDLSFIGDNQILNSSVLFRKKFHKKGRTFSTNIITNYSNNASNGYLYSKSEFYTNPTSTQTEITDQYKKNANNTFGVNTKLVYTEPLSGNANIGISYALELTNNNSDRDSYNKDLNGKYNLSDSLFSNHYEFHIITHKGGVKYALNTKKIRFSIGNDIGYTRFNQKDIQSTLVYQRNFINWFPQINFGYVLGAQKSINISYIGSTIQPGLSQIQPLKTNSDPLNIVIGNKILTPSFSNSIELTYLLIKSIENKSFWATFSYNIINDAISTNDFLDLQGRKTSQYININGNKYFKLYAQYDFKWKKPDIDISISNTLSINRNVNIINSSVNNTDFNTYAIGLSIEKSISKKVDVNIRYSLVRTSSNSSINQYNSLHYWTHNIRPSIDLFLPFKTQFHSDLSILLIQQSKNFTGNSNIYLWNAWYGKKLFKNEAFDIRFMASDLLNSNLGVIRTVNTNFISQNTYSTIQRYFMLSLIWNFTKSDKKP